jgi:hypothetical protein
LRFPLPSCRLGLAADFIEHQSGQAVSLCETVDETFFVLMDSPQEVACHAGVTDGIVCVGHDADAHSFAHVVFRRLPTVTAGMKIAASLRSSQ